MFDPVKNTIQEIECAWVNSTWVLGKPLREL